MHVHSAYDATYETIHLTNKQFPYWTVSYIVEGELEVTDAAVIQSAGSGQVMIHAPDIPFGERAFRPGHHKWLLLEASNCYGIDLFRLFPVTEVVTVSEPARFEALLGDIIRLWAEPAAPFRGIRLAGLALQLAGCILQDWEREGMTARKTQLSRKDERLDRVITHLMAHAFGKVSREDLAKLVHLNPNYLDRIFEERFR